MKIHGELKSGHGISCSCDTVCQWSWHVQSSKKDLTDEPWVRALKSAIKMMKHAISRWSPYLSSGNKYNLLLFTWYSSSNYLQRTWFERGLKWVPNFMTGAYKMERMRCAKQMLTTFELEKPKQTTDIATGDEPFISFRNRPSKQ